MVLYTLLDSWASGYNDETRKDRDGWPQLLGLTPDQVIAVAGSKACDWATGAYRGRIECIPRESLVVCTMGGNDAIAAGADGNVTVGEMRGVATSMFIVARALKDKNCRVLLLGYADPYHGTIPQISYWLKIFNASLALIAELHAFDYLDTSSCLDESCFMAPGHGIHPNNKGHEVLAGVVKGWADGKA